MGFSALSAASDAAIFEVMGEVADWGTLVGVKVVVAEPDEIIDLEGGETRLVVGTHVLHVRRSEVPAPLKGDYVTVYDVIGQVAGRYQVIARPMLDTMRAVWACEARAVAEG